MGYLDSVELREQLVHANVSFSTEIIGIQENITNGLNQVNDIIASILRINFKPSEYIQTTLIPPVVLILQLVEMTLSSVGNILSVFTTAEIPFDPYFFLNKFVPLVIIAVYIRNNIYVKISLIAKTSIIR